MFAPSSRSRQSQSSSNILNMSASGGGGDGLMGRPGFTREYSEMGGDGDRRGSIVEAFAVRRVTSGGSEGGEERRHLLMGNGEEYGIIRPRET